MTKPLTSIRDIMKRGLSAREGIALRKAERQERTGKILRSFEKNKNKR